MVKQRLDFGRSALQWHSRWFSRVSKVTWQLNS